MARTTRSRRRYAAVAGVAVTLLLTGACGDKNADKGAEPAKVDELVIQSLYTKANKLGAPFYAATERFTEQTGIKVRVQETADNGGDVYETARLAGKEADIVIINLVEKTTRWVDNKAVVPVDQYLDQWGLRGRVRPEAIKEWTSAGGKIQGFPYAGFNWPVWYNTELLTKAGVSEPPKNTDELIAAAGKLRAAGIAPLAVGGKDWSGQKLFLQVAQAYLQADQTRKLFAEGGFCASPEAMKGIELFTRLRDAKVFVDDVQGYTVQLMAAAYTSTKAAMMYTGSWSYAGTSPEIAKNTYLGGLPMPSDSAFTQPTALQGYNSAGMFVSPNGSKKLSAVEKFVKVMYDPATVKDFVTRASLIPALSSEQNLADAPDPLLNQAVTKLDSRVTFAVHPDRYVGSRADALIRVTGEAFGPGVNAQRICKAVDGVYQK